MALKHHHFPFPAFENGDRHAETAETEVSTQKNADASCLDNEYISCTKAPAFRKQCKLGIKTTGALLDYSVTQRNMLSCL